MASVKTAKYLGVAEAIKHQIEDLGPYSLLPSEDALAKRFGLSRVTIRRALGLLERSGLVSRDRGRGTIVNSPKITRRFGPFYRFEEDLTDQGIKFQTEVLKYEVQSEPPRPVLERFKLAPGTPVGFLSLARLVDERIVCCDFRYLPPAIAERFDAPLVKDRPVYEILIEIAGMPITAVEWETEILPSSPEVASILRITPGVLVVANNFADLLDDGSVIEAGVMYFRIDRFKFKTVQPWRMRTAGP